MLLKRPRGTADVLPTEKIKWKKITETFRALCSLYGYQELCTPIFEYTELFKRTVGETTDVVEKEMYIFEDRAKRSLALRPEGTAPVVRAFLENSLYHYPRPVKLAYLGPMFRYGRPQAGRLRQFFQLGIEALGAGDPTLDAEVVAFAQDFFRRLGLKNTVTLQLNSVGCPRCRPPYREKLQAYLALQKEKLCPTCRNRYLSNPLRVLDCKEASCQAAITGAPLITDYLCPECKEHFQAVREYLDLLSLPYTLNPHLVRGLDYYTNTAFEFEYPALGAQKALGGGGRYNGLVEECGGPPTPGLGLSFGLERVLLALEKERAPLPLPAPCEVFLAVATPKAKGKALQLLQSLREAGIRAEKDYLDRSLKAQLRAASRLEAKYVLILGQEELAQGVVSIREMKTGNQEEVKQEEVISYLGAKVKHKSEVALVGYFEDA